MWISAGLLGSGYLVFWCFIYDTSRWTVDGRGWVFRTAAYTVDGGLWTVGGVVEEIRRCVVGLANGNSAGRPNRRGDREERGEKGGKARK